MSEIVRFNQTELSFIRNIIDIIKNRGFGYHHIPFFEKTISAITIKTFLPGHKYIGHYNVFANNASSIKDISVKKHVFGINDIENVEHKDIINSILKEALE